MDKSASSDIINMKCIELVERSRKFCEKAKEYFAHQNVSEVVIEIDSGPISNWKIISTPTDLEMFHQRDRLATLELPFIAIYRDEGRRQFFYADEVIYRLEDIETGEIRLEDIRFENEFDMNKIKEELKNLIQELKRAN